MLKLLGIIMIFIGCTGMGFSYKNQLEEKIWHLKEIKQAFLLISSSIRYGKATLPESCKEASLKLEEPYQTIFREIYNQMEQKKGIPFPTIWKQEIEKMSKKLLIGDKGKKLLLEFGMENGYLDIDLQQQAINRYMEEFDVLIKELEKNIKEKSKIAICFGMMGGMFLAIVFI